MKNKTYTFFIAILFMAQLYTFAQDTPWGDNNGAQSAPCVTNSTTWFLGGNDITPLIGNNNPSTPQNYTQENNIGTCNDFDFILKAKNNKTIWIKPNTKVGISVVNPSAKFEVLETNVLSSEVGGSMAKLISSFRTISTVGNDIQHNNWVYKITPSPGFNNHTNGSWEDYALHDGVSIDGYHHTPATDTHTWWERLPGESTHKWGDHASTFLKIAPNFMQIMEQANAPNTAVLNLNVSGVDAFDVFDAISQKVNFRVKSTGFVFAREINVMASHIVFPDYVFESNYKLKSLESLESYIAENKHLPNIPSAKEVAANGINLGELQVKQMEKIEELYLYLIQQQKEIEKLKEQNCKLERLIKKH